MNMWIKVTDALPSIGQLVGVMYVDTDDGEIVEDIDEFDGVNDYTKDWYYNGCSVFAWRPATYDEIMEDIWSKDRMHKLEGGV